MDRAQGHFLKSTCDMMHIDLRKDITDMTWGHCHFLKLTCKIGDPISRDPKKRGGEARKYLAMLKKGNLKDLK